MKIQKTFTKNGCRLISKSKYNPSKNKSHFVETVKIETNFGKGLTTIVSYFDSNKKLSNRIIEKKLGKNTEKTIFTYTGSIKTKKTSLIRKYINGRKTQTIINTEVLNKKEKQPYLTRIKLIQTPDKNGNRHETQTIEELSTNKHRKYIKTTAKRSISGILYNKTLEGNTGNLNRLRKSKYLYFLNYSLKDFLNSIFPYAQKLQKVKNKEILYTFEPLQGNISGSSNTVADTGILKFDLTKEFSKYAVVRLVNHELRHQYQDLMISKFKQKGLKGFIARIIHPFKYSYSKQCEESFKNYIPSSVDYKKYLKNYVEIDARAAAMTANQEYLKEMFFLNKIFSKSKELFSRDIDSIKILAHMQNSKHK